MIALRPCRFPEDLGSLLALDTSFTTDRVFHLKQANHGFKLDEVAAEPPLHKSYSLVDAVALMPGQDSVTIAELNDGVVGVAAVTVEEWNRRAVLHHLYVTREARRIGVGHALVTSAIRVARERSARCIWVETQTINYAAVQFYRSMGFEWCGFDTSLYDPSDAGVDEVALFFSRNVG